jgi:hypothetical protein
MVKLGVLPSPTTERTRRHRKSTHSNIVQIQTHKREGPAAAFLGGPNGYRTPPLATARREKGEEEVAARV